MQALMARWAPTHERSFLVSAVSVGKNQFMGRQFAKFAKRLMSCRIANWSNAFVSSGWTNYTFPQLGVCLLHNGRFRSCRWCLCCKFILQLKFCILKFQTFGVVFPSGGFSCYPSVYFNGGKKIHSSINWN